MTADLPGPDTGPFAVPSFFAPPGRVADWRLVLVLEPKLAATVLGIVGSMLSGEAVVKGRTPFADRAGQVIASPLLTLVDDPTDVRSLGADTYDGEGLACRRNVLIEVGTLQGFLHNSATARRAGTRSTEIGRAHV